MNPDVGVKIKARVTVIESCDCSGGRDTVAKEGNVYSIVFKGYSGSHFRNELGTLSKYNSGQYEIVSEPLTTP